MEHRRARTGHRIPTARIAAAPPVPDRHQQKPDSLRERSIPCARSYDPGRDLLPEANPEADGAIGARARFQTSIEFWGSGLQMWTYEEEGEKRKPGWLVPGAAKENY